MDTTPIIGVLFCTVDVTWCGNLAECAADIKCLYGCIGPDGPHTCPVPIQWLRRRVFCLGVRFGLPHLALTTPHSGLHVRAQSTLLSTTSITSLTALTTIIMFNTNTEQCNCTSTCNCQAGSCNCVKN
ncbi:hypothetical protein BDR07DRAFT_52773 [Suillus spraguei]|nr:hypothetical protein BDR07DRAFT_52773 [Suillus spraguei]